MAKNGEERLNFMLVLDTDHLSELEVRSAVGLRLLRRLEQSREDAVITAVTYEEQLRGWLAEIHRQKRPRDQITGYARLIRTIAPPHDGRSSCWTRNHPPPLSV